MRAFRLRFAVTPSAHIDRGVDLTAAVVVAHRDGEPLLVPRSGPLLADSNLLLFTNMALFRSSLRDGLLSPFAGRGLAPHLRPAIALDWASQRGFGVMVDPILEAGRVVCGSLVGATILSANSIGGVP